MVGDSSATFLACFSKLRHNKTAVCPWWHEFGKGGKGSDMERDNFSSPFASSFLEMMNIFPTPWTGHFNCPLLLFAVTTQISCSDHCILEHWRKGRIWCGVFHWQRLFLVLCVYVCKFTCMWVYMHIYADHRTVSALPCLAHHSPCFIFLVIGFLTASGTHQLSQVGWPVSSRVVLSSLLQCWD